MARIPDDPTKAQAWVTKGLDELDFEFYFPQGPKGDPGGLVLGTDLGSTINLNDLKSSGIYRQTNSSNTSLLLNYPTLRSGILEVFERIPGSHATQRYTITDGPNNVRTMYVRSFATPNWGAWSAIQSSRVDQTAGRAIYQWDDLNVREQLIYGDTGWRQVIVAGDIVGLPNMNGYVRRIGNQVSFQAFEVTAGGTASGATTLWNTPTGFRYVLGASPAMVSGSVIDSGAAPVANASIYLASAGAYNVTLRAVAGVRHYATLNWLTTDAWPTVLPGTAFASIPNA